MAVAAMLALTPQVLATDITDIGFVDQAAIGSLKPFQDAQAQFAQARDQLSKQFQSAIKGKSRADEQRIFNDFNGRASAKQHDIFGPLLARTQIAIAAVAANKNLSVVVDKQIIIVGGQDITKDVINMLNQPGQLVPPVNTPPPSEVGLVDQQQINSLPKVKKANADFLQARQALQSQLNGQLAGKTADQQKPIIASFNQQLSDQQKKLLQPIVDATEKAISNTAKSKNLLLVIDATNRVYGGTDVTADVVRALQ
ncbi:MAG: hypothetical protein GIW99_11340 [Candidatus Eremiobacteraeota bacterium]|nr:hypothetical protein [Candidatus Eremiobacteraeota bacterium]